MVKEKTIEIENFQKITDKVDINNINDLEILYLEVIQNDSILRQLEKLDIK